MQNDRVRVINDIEVLRHNWRANTDAGASMMEYIGASFNKWDLERQIAYKAFFFDEIKNSGKYFKYCLEIISKINNFDICEELFKLYKNIAISQDIHWRYSIIVALMRANYKKGKKTYKDFIIEYEKTNEVRMLFYLNVLYFYVDSSKGLDLLIKYFKNYFYINSDHYEFIYGRLGYLFHFIFKMDTLENKMFVDKIRGIDSEISKTILHEFQKSLEDLPKVSRL